MDLLLLLGTAIPSAEVHKARRTVKLLQGTTTHAQGNVAALHTPSGQNVVCAPIAPHFEQRIYLPPAACALLRARTAGHGSVQEEEIPDDRARPCGDERKRALHAPGHRRGGARVH